MGGLQKNGNCVHVRENRFADVNQRPKGFNQMSNQSVSLTQSQSFKSTQNNESNVINSQFNSQRSEDPINHNRLCSNIKNSNIKQSESH